MLRAWICVFALTVALAGCGRAGKVTRTLASLLPGSQTTETVLTEAVPGA